MPMRIFLLLAVLLSTAIQAKAQNALASGAPPEEPQVPFEGELTVPAFSINVYRIPIE